MNRRTVIVQSAAALRERRKKAARAGDHGLEISTAEHTAARLAGGFFQPIRGSDLRAALQEVLPVTKLGELDDLRELPGMVSASATTLRRVWLAGIDLAERAPEHPRLSALSRLEEAVLEAMPRSKRRPQDLVELAISRCGHAASILGSIEISGVMDLPKCWHPMIQCLARQVPVRWIAGPRDAPNWLDSAGVAVEKSPAKSPRTVAETCANARHEAIEALRWARELMAVQGEAASDIAIVSVTPHEYDTHFLSLREDANLDLEFLHGVPVVAFRDGQAACALAEIVLRGISQSRVRRLAAYLSGGGGIAGDVPRDWHRTLPRDAPMTSRQAWEQWLASLSADSFSDGVNHAHGLRVLIELLLKGSDYASEIGEAVLSRRALGIWRQALCNGPPGSLELNLQEMKCQDQSIGVDGIAWMPASDLAACPRRFVRLLGLNSARWPRGLSEDRLLPDHVIPGLELNPMPPNARDRLDFSTILKSTEREVVLSRSRRESDGRLMGRSALLRRDLVESHLLRNRTPSHAFSRTDRWTARHEEFQEEPLARCAAKCWIDWRNPLVTAHDGLIRKSHPVIEKTLARLQSASSLRLLLRNPLGFVWRYALKLKEPEIGEESLELDLLTMGSLIHEVLELAILKLEDNGSYAAADKDEIAAKVDEAIGEVGAQWESEHAVPPLLIWEGTLRVAEAKSKSALWPKSKSLHEGSRSYSEVPFGGFKGGSKHPPSWNVDGEVRIPETDLRIRGAIDRLDISKDGTRVDVIDYKTGRVPRRDYQVGMRGGSELQRCLYAFAAKTLLGEKVEVSASLLYADGGSQRYLTLEDRHQVLVKLQEFLNRATDSLKRGYALPGPDAGSNFDDMAFALPSSLAGTVFERKEFFIRQKLGPVSSIWEEQ